MMPRQRRADEFARLLDLGGSTDEPALAPLLFVTGRLQALPAGPAPTREFRAALRQRLVAVAGVQAAAGAEARPTRTRSVRPLSWGSQRRFAFAGAALAVGVLVAGVAGAASRSLPGDPFYGLKRAAESVQLTFTHGSYDRGKLELEFARTRLHEVQALVGRGVALAPAHSGWTGADGLVLSAASTGEVTGTLKVMDAEIRAGSRNLTRAYQQSHSTRPLTLLRTFAAQQTAGLAALLPVLPPAARAADQQSINLIGLVNNRAVSLLVYGPCTTRCIGTPSSDSRARTDQIGVLPCRCRPGSGGVGGTTGGPTGSSARPGTSPTPGSEPTVPLLNGTPTLPSLPVPTSPSLPVPHHSGTPLPTLTILPSLPLPTISTSLLPL